MTEDSGRVGSAETGSRPAGQAPSGLDASRFDPARMEKAREGAAAEAIAGVAARGVGFYPGKIRAAYLAGQFDRSAAVQRRLCTRCNGTGMVSGIIDDDLLISGSWPCERCSPPRDRP